jgi:hypothetical protein
VSTPLLRVISGELDHDELAALTAVLLVRRTAHRHDDDATALSARWQRPERRRRYGDPVSWRTPTG